MTMYGEHTPAVGTLVMTADGAELGTVKETQGGCFKVDAPMAPDYWLGSDLAAESIGGVVRLSISKDMLGEAKQDSPDEMRDHRGYHRHNS